MSSYLLASKKLRKWDDVFFKLALSISSLILFFFHVCFTMFESIVNVPPPFNMRINHTAHNSLILSDKGAAMKLGFMKNEPIRCRCIVSGSDRQLHVTDWPMRGRQLKVSVLATVSSQRFLLVNIASRQTKLHLGLVESIYARGHYF